MNNKKIASFFACMLLLVAAQAQQAVTVTYNSNGSGTITIPQDATNVNGQATGAGGGGGAAGVVGFRTNWDCYNGVAGIAAGGGGEGYTVSNSFAVGSYSITVGKGGDGGYISNFSIGSGAAACNASYGSTKPSASATAGTKGGTSSIGIVVTADGGNGGGSRFTYSNSSTDEGGWTIAGGTGNSNGQNGYWNNSPSTIYNSGRWCDGCGPDRVHGGQGGGATSYNGGQSSGDKANGGWSGSVGTNAGAGGGGGACRSNNQSYYTGAGGKGADGKVVINFTLPKPTFSTSKNPICAGESATLTVTNQSVNATYTWKLNGTTKDTGTSISISEAGNWTVTANYNIAYTGLTPTFSKNTSSIDVVSDRINIIVNERTVPNFDVQTTYCQNEPPQTFHTISPNEVIGTWSPATINTTTAGTTNYVFTPNVGQCATIQTATITVIPETSTWIGGNENWANPANWSNGLPDMCTDVVIISGSYPVIPTGAVCRNIYFEHGAGALGLQNLTYEKAFVDLKLARDRWYLLTAPLQNMFSGDFYFEGSPITYMRLFDKEHPDDHAARTGTFTRSFATLKTPLTPGLGFAFKVDAQSWDFPNGRISNDNHMEISFPRRTDENSLITSFKPYVASTGQLYPQSMAQYVERTDSAYRLAMRNEYFQVQDNQISIQIPADEIGNDGLFLVGNPMMAHLNFGKLCESNETAIESEVKVFDVNYTTQKIVGEECYSSIEGEDNLHFAPMQAFLLRKKCVGDVNLTFHLDEHFCAPDGDKPQLRATTTQKPNRLYIAVDNGTSRSSTLIALNDRADNNFGSDDAAKLFAPYPEGAEVYTLAEGKRLDINLFQEAPFIAPIGLKSTAALRAAKGSQTTLHFSGAESFADADVFLVNAATGEEVNLKEENSYEIELTDDQTEGMLFVEFRKTQLTTYCKPSVSDASTIQIFAAEGNTVRMLSATENPIRQVIVLDESGKNVVNAKHIDASLFDAKLGATPHIYLVRVVTDREVKTEKVLLK